jgi:3-dehydrotetronate 4-kinase
MASILLGCIADDFTGATDLANNLVRSGMRVVQTIGTPMQPLAESVDAVVVSLKSRTTAPEEAVQQSIEALNWLRMHHAQQIYFKYCSTFDSTDRGNIGPVIDALMQALDTGFTIATPAFPDAGRTVYRGYLFVNDVLLNESGMQNHPLTPMRDANLQRVLQPQTSHRVGLVDYRACQCGVTAIKQRFDELKSQGCGVAIVDALQNVDLLELAKAVSDLPLVTAGSGLAIGIAHNFGIEPNRAAADLPVPQGLKAIVAGSCSQATLGQVAHFRQHCGRAFCLDPLQIGDDEAKLHNVIREAIRALDSGPVLVYSTASLHDLSAAQARFGAANIGLQIEHWLSVSAQALVAAGVRQLIVAGGETSGAVVKSLGIEQLRIGEQIDPGVPWCYGSAQLKACCIDLHICLKSGNFGAQDFFTRAYEVL